MLVYQVPIPEPLRFLEPRETETRKMHALEEYGLMHVKLYEDIARHGHIATTYAYPVKVEGRYVMDPSPTPKFDNPKMHMSPALQLFGAGREKRIYAVPPFTRWSASISRTIRSRCRRSTSPARCAAAEDVYLDEVDPRRPRRPHVRLLRHRPLRERRRRARRAIGGDMGRAAVAAFTRLALPRETADLELRTP